MSIAAKFTTSWRLAFVCLRLLARNKTLLMFPITTFCLWIVMGILFFAPVTLIHTGYNIWEAKHWESVAEMFKSAPAGGATISAANFQMRVSTENIVYWAIVYVAAMFLGTFANVAFYHEILAALRGEPVSLLNGFRFALSRWHAIFAWSLFAGAIGVAIRNIEQRVGFIGQIIAGLVGTVWSVACLFVIPVLVESDAVNPIRALRHSASILKRTWGETIIGYAGLAFGNAIVAFCTVLILIATVVYGFAMQTVWLPASVAAAWIALLIVYSYVMGIASRIYLGALYIYAAEGSAPRGFTGPMLSAAWKHKK